MKHLIKFLETVDGPAKFLKIHHIEDGEENRAVKFGWFDQISLEGDDIKFLMEDDNAK